MALILEIGSIVQKVGTAYPKVLTEILHNMKTFRERRAYREYVQSLDFASPAARKAVSDALYGLWAYCAENDLPLLNMLVVHKASGLPSIGIESWYEEKFQTLNGYTDSCDIHARLAEFMLGKGILELR